MKHTYMILCRKFCTQFTFLSLGSNRCNLLLFILFDYTLIIVPLVVRDCSFIPSIFTVACLDAGR